MNKKLCALISGILLTTSLVNTEVGAVTKETSQLEASYENINNDNPIVREFIATSTNEFAKAGDRCEVYYYSSTNIKCINRTTGRVFACNPTTSYVGYGYSNPEGSVGCLQGLFNCLGADLAVDGLFGPKTHQKILEFQQKNSNILSVDGIAGPKTFAWAVELVFGVVQPINDN